MTLTYLPSHALLPAGHMNGAQLATATGLTYRQIDFWTRAGYLEPVNTAPGSGYQRSYTPAEISVAMLMADLVHDGLSPAAACARARELIDTGTTRIAGIAIHLPEEP